MESRNAHKRELQILYLAGRLQFPALPVAGHSKRQGDQRARHLLSQPHGVRADIGEQVYHGCRRIHAARQYDESPHSIRREKCVLLNGGNCSSMYVKGIGNTTGTKATQLKNLNKPCVIESEFSRQTACSGSTPPGNRSWADLATSST